MAYAVCKVIKKREISAPSSTILRLRTYNFLLSCSFKVKDYRNDRIDEIGNPHGDEWRREARDGEC